jgi:hypothetical protein
MAIGTQIGFAIGGLAPVVAAAVQDGPRRLEMGAVITAESKVILNHDLEMGITGIYVHVDLLPRMREWLDRLSAHYDSLIAVPATISNVPTKAHLPAVQAKAAMTTKARKLERKTRAAELDMEIMRAREANGLPVISPMLGLPPEKWECEFRDYLVALGDPRVADPEWLAARIREEQRRARWFEKWFDAWFEESAGGFDFGKEEVRRPVGQPQHPRRTPEERQGAMKAAHAGVAAFADGIAESSCPHKVATLAYSAWRKGWQEARDRAGP